VIVLDTHAWIWWADNPRLLSKRARAAIDDADAIGVSVSSCYEAARSVARGRLALLPDSRSWMTRALSIPRVELLDLTTRVAIAAADLDWTHGDPFDRIIVATGMTWNAPVVSKDHRIRLFKPARAIW